MAPQAPGAAQALSPRTPPLAAPASTPNGAGLPVPRPPAERWRAAVETVKAASTRHGASLAFARLSAFQEAELTLAFPPTAGFHRATVGGAGKSAIEKALSQFFGRPVRLKFDDRDEAFQRAPESLAEVDAKGRADREKSTESKVRTHPAIRAALKHLGGEIEHVQVLDEPRSPSAPAEGAAPQTPEEPLRGD